MQQPRRVFLSHTSEFASFPKDRSFVDAAIAAVGRAKDAATDMSYFTSRDTQPADYCIREVRDCQVYVGIIGLRYGSPVPDRPELSHTELEFETASEPGAEKKRFIFLLDPNALVPPAMFTDAKCEHRQLAFREKLSESDIMTAPFKTPDELHLLVYQALKESRTDAHPSEPQQQYRLKSWTEKVLPSEPYPLLRPYEHPDLLAGRDRELDDLERLLARNVPIISVHSTSGAGKSSLLQAGLQARLGRKGRAVAYTAYPSDPKLSTRLLKGFLSWDGERGFSDDAPEEFRRAVEEARRLSEAPAVLILDQFEDVMAPAAGDARQRIANLLTETVEEDPHCRWVLSYRHEYHGEVDAWLQDAFAQAGLTRRGRFQTYPLKPLADFLSAIRAPLRFPETYDVRFAKGADESLAAAFARKRREHPMDPLVPQLQVVLHDLLDSAADGEIRLPEDPEEKIDGALADHLRKAVKEVAESRQGRAEVLLGLRELADDDGKRNEGRPVAELEAILPKEILKELSDEYRILYKDPREGREYYLLAHDRIAEVVVEEMENPRIKEWLDEELVALGRIVTRKAEMLGDDRNDATNLSPETFQRISHHQEALVADGPRRAWWEACVERNRERPASSGTSRPPILPGPRWTRWPNSWSTVGGGRNCPLCWRGDRTD